eukprot:jgi/Tetstr1/454295/TSEL_041214.t1
MEQPTSGSSRRAAGVLQVVPRTSSGNRRGGLSSSGKAASSRGLLDAACVLPVDIPLSGPASASTDTSLQRGADGSAPRQLPFLKRSFSHGSKRGVEPRRFHHQADISEPPAQVSEPADATPSYTTDIASICRRMLSVLVSEGAPARAAQQGPARAASDKFTEDHSSEPTLRRIASARVSGVLSLAKESTGLNDGPHPLRAALSAPVAKPAVAAPAGGDADEPESPAELMALEALYTPAAPLKSLRPSSKQFNCHPIPFGLTFAEQPLCAET